MRIWSWIESDDPGFCVFAQRSQKDREIEAEEKRKAEERAKLERLASLERAKAEGSRRLDALSERKAAIGACMCWALPLCALRLAVTVAALLLWARSV